MELKKMSWYAFEQLKDQIPFAILPVGSIEQHGRHLPLGSDSLVANGFAKQLAKGTNALVLPCIEYGIVFKYADWPGTIGLESLQFQAVIHRIGQQLEKQNLRKLLILNGHDENKEALICAAQVLKQTFGIETIAVEWAHIVVDQLLELLTSKNEIHGGEILTSLLLHWHPELVNMELAMDVEVVKKAFVDDMHGLRNVYTTDTDPFTHEKAGVSGYPKNADAELGKAIEKVVNEKLLEIIDNANWNNC